MHCRLNPTTDNGVLTTQWVNKRRERIVGLTATKDNRQNVPADRKNSRHLT